MNLKLSYVKKQLHDKHFYIDDKKKLSKKPHLVFALINENGQVCVNIKTHFSVHPGQDYINNSILKLMSEQLHLERQKDWQDYIKCDKSYQWLLDYLHKKGYKTTE